jgi:hypothetical protein
VSVEEGSIVPEPGERTTESTDEPAVDGYRGALQRILSEFSAETATRLSRLSDAADDAGAGVEGIVVDVFVDQDGEGPFDVWARFEGRDAFVLDRRFDDRRHLFGVVWGEDGWDPEVPSRPRGWTRDDLEAAVVDAVAEWIELLLPAGAPADRWRIGAPGEFFA